MQYQISWSNRAINIIQKLRLIFLSLTISGIVKAESNTFYKYEYEYTICVQHKRQTGLQIRR